MSLIAGFAGIFLWTLLEYLLHRFVFHDRVLGGRPAREHAEHHAKVDWFAPWSTKLLLAAPILLGLTALAWPLLGAGAGASLAGGVVGGWLAYEALHRAIHVRAPRTAVGRFLWRHHLHHHAVDARTNHGVSSPLWDLVFGTLARSERVVLAPKMAAKLPWLLDDAGRVRPELQATYALR